MKLLRKITKISNFFLFVQADVVLTRAVFCFVNKLRICMYICQLNKFVADERKKFTIFPEESQVFSFTKMCDFNQVGLSL